MIINVHHRYFKPIKDGSVTAIIRKSLKENIKVNETILLDFNTSKTLQINVTVTKIERLRLDELTYNHVIACGYSHMDLFEDHIIKDLDIDKTDGTLIYFIFFTLNGLEVVNNFRESILTPTLTRTSLSMWDLVK